MIQPPNTGSRNFLAGLLQGYLGEKQRREAIGREDAEIARQREQQDFANRMAQQNLDLNRQQEARSADYFNWQKGQAERNAQLDADQRTRDERQGHIDFLDKLALSDMSNMSPIKQQYVTEIANIHRNALGLQPMEWQPGANPGLSAEDRWNLDNDYVDRGQYMMPGSESAKWWAGRYKAATGEDAPEVPRFTPATGGQLLNANIRTADMANDYAQGQVRNANSVISTLVGTLGAKVNDPAVQQALGVLGQYMPAEPSIPYTGNWQSVIPQGGRPGLSVEEVPTPTLPQNAPPNVTRVVPGNAPVPKLTFPPVGEGYGSTITGMSVADAGNLAARQATEARLASGGSGSSSSKESPLGKALQDKARMAGFWDTALKTEYNRVARFMGNKAYYDENGKLNAAGIKARDEINYSSQGKTPPASKPAPVQRPRLSPGGAAAKKVGDYFNKHAVWARDGKTAKAGRDKIVAGAMKEFGYDGYAVGAEVDRLFKGVVDRWAAKHPAEKSKIARLRSAGAPDYEIYAELF